MPTYDFKCRQCDRVQENVLLRITHDDADKPECCGATMEYHITQAPMVSWVDPVIEPFRQPALPGNPLITSAKQNRELMARHDMVDANDLGPPPTHKDQKKQLAEMNESVKAITPTAKQEQELKKAGLDTILD